jgi:LuxR family transcriptional regulator, maltose regulon positive regulatory protein
LLTYALLYFAVQARIELIRVHVALADLPGARTLMQEVDELLKRRPSLGTLAARPRRSEPGCRRSAVPALPERRR